MQRNRTSARITGRPWNSNQQSLCCKGWSRSRRCPRQEARRAPGWSSRWPQAGYDRAFVDAAGNAVGELGPADADQVVVLLGHIDTVPGNIPVRIEASDGRSCSVRPRQRRRQGSAGDGDRGRGARSAAPGPTPHNLRLVVVGAVEEEAATSKGARFIRDRFDGVREPVPTACIIGEPSGWQRVTLGYKGRLLVDLDARSRWRTPPGPMLAWPRWWSISGTGSTPMPPAATRAATRPLTSSRPACAGCTPAPTTAMHDHVTAQAGIRLPLDFDGDIFADALITWAEERTGIEVGTTARPTVVPEQDTAIVVAGNLTTIRLQLRAHELAFRGDRNNALVRAFLGAVRTVDPTAKPGFLVKSGTSDMNVVGPAWNCPILAYGPGDSSLDHTPQRARVTGRVLAGRVGAGTGAAQSRCCGMIPPA